jgi:hypothetical protein
MNRRLIAPVIVAVVLACVAFMASTNAQQTTPPPIPEAPLYTLLPFEWPHPIFPMCSTQYGICRVGLGSAAGAPCSCLAANGQWIPGYVTRNAGGR